MQNFTASVQYGDWEGTVAADDADANALANYLEKKRLIRPGEFLIAASFWAGENYDGKLGRVSVRAFLLNESQNFERAKRTLAASKGPIPVRVLDIPLKLQEFVALFKRFEIMLTWHDLSLEGREYSVAEQ